MNTRLRLLGMALIATVAFSACSGSQTTLPNVQANAIAPTATGGNVHAQSCTQIMHAGDRTAQGCTDPGDPCQGGSLTICGGTGFPPPPGNPGGQGGGNGPGHCPQLVGGNPCFPTAPGNPVSHTDGPAVYNDQCTKDSEFVGHPIPGLSPTQANSISNEYPVTLGTGTIGYVYTTYGSGKAYFVPVSSAVGAGIVSIGIDQSFPVGTNGFVQGNAGQNTLLTVLIKVITAGKAPTLQSACFTSDWDGTYPA